MKSKAAIRSYLRPSGREKVFKYLHLQRFEQTDPETLVYKVAHLFPLIRIRSVRRYVEEWLASKGDSSDR